MQWQYYFIFIYKILFYIYICDVLNNLNVCGIAAMLENTWYCKQHYSVLFKHYYYSWTMSLICKHRICVHTAFKMITLHTCSLYRPSSFTFTFTLHAADNVFRYVFFLGLSLFLASGHRGPNVICHCLVFLYE